MITSRGSRRQCHTLASRCLWCYVKTDWSQQKQWPRKKERFILYIQRLKCGSCLELFNDSVTLDNLLVIIWTRVSSFFKEKLFVLPVSCCGIYGRYTFSFATTIFMEDTVVLVSQKPHLSVTLNTKLLSFYIKMRKFWVGMAILWWDQGPAHINMCVYIHTHIYAHMCIFIYYQILGERGGGWGRGCCL